MLTPFHLAVQVRDIAEAREFYGSKLGFSEGRSAETWIDWNMYGHQVVTHLNPNLGPEGKVLNHRNPVDSKSVPVPHFGVVMTIPDWGKLAEKARTFVDEFIIEPYVRFKGGRANSVRCSLRTLQATRWSSRPSRTLKDNYLRSSLGSVRSRSQGSRRLATGTTANSALL